MEGMAVSAGFQTSGRGQRGATWESGAGMNILLSVLLAPKFLKISEQFLLSQAMAISVRNFISAVVQDKHVQVKWPNDILVDGKKISGILIENILEGDTIKNSIIGIGINVNQEELLPTATSIIKLLNTKSDIKALEESLFIEMEKTYLQLKRGEYKVIKSIYESNLYGIGEEREFEDLLNGNQFKGKISGVSESGQLFIIDSENKTRQYDLKEIRFL